VPSKISAGDLVTTVDQVVTAKAMVVEAIGSRVGDDLAFGLFLSVLDGEESGAEELVFYRSPWNDLDAQWTGELHLEVDQVLRASFIGVTSGTPCFLKVHERKA